MTVQTYGRERERERERESKRFWGRKRTCASVALFGHVFAKSSATLWQSAKVRPRAATEGRLQSAASASASLPMETAAPPSRSRRDALTPSACVSLCLSASLAVSLCVSLWFSLSPSPALSLSLPLSLSLAVSTQIETPPAPRASSSRRLRPQAIAVGGTEPWLDLLQGCLIAGGLKDHVVLLLFCS